MADQQSASAEPSPQERRPGSASGAPSGLPVFLADVKGGLSGLATAATSSDTLTERITATGMPWTRAAVPVEFLALGGDGRGIPVRATVDSFGPLLLARIMDLNETQESCLQMMFHWADGRGLPLDDLKDLRAVVMHLTSDEGKEDLRGLGGVAASTANVILREVTALAAGGMDAFFGVPEFETAELLRRAPDGRGVISCLGQLVNPVQHALRTSTPKDARALRQTVQTFPHTEYDFEEGLTSAGTGEAVVTVLDEAGAPTPVALTRMWSPTSVIGPSALAVLDGAVVASALLPVHGQGRESAFERLAGTGRAWPDGGAAGAGAESGSGPGPGGGGAGRVPRGIVPTGGSVGSHTPGAGQSQADIDAEARRTEAEVLGHPLPSSGTAPRGSGRSTGPRSRREENPVADGVEDIARTAATAFGRSLVRSVLGTRRRGRRRRRRGGLFG